MKITFKYKVSHKEEESKDFNWKSPCLINSFRVQLVGDFTVYLNITLGPITFTQMQGHWQMTA